MATTVRAAPAVVGHPCCACCGCRKCCGLPASSCSRNHDSLPLWVHVFCCAVVQRFLERGGPEVQGAVAEAIRGKALPLSLQVSSHSPWCFPLVLPPPRCLACSFLSQWGCWCSSALHRSQLLISTAERSAAQHTSMHSMRCSCSSCQENCSSALAILSSPRAPLQVYGCRVVQKALEVGPGPVGFRASRSGGLANKGQPGSIQCMQQRPHPTNTVCSPPLLEALGYALKIT